jgi:type II secretory pathway pseudopilin PulG
MLVVLALMGVLTAAVSLSLRGTARAARAADVAGRLAGFDRSAREAARRLGRPVELRFDLSRGTVHRAAGGEAPTPLRLPDGFRVTGLALPGGTVGAGEVRVPVSARGQTPSYAARVEGPEAAEGDVWLMAAGLTGRTVVLRDAGEVQDIFRSGGRADAD